MWQAKRAKPFKTEVGSAGVDSPHWTFTEMSFNAFRSICDAKFSHKALVAKSPLHTPHLTAGLTLAWASDSGSPASGVQSHSWVSPLLGQTSQALVYCNTGGRGSTEEGLFLFPANSFYSCSSSGVDTVICELLWVRKRLSDFQSPGYFLQFLIYLQVSSNLQLLP